MAEITGRCLCGQISYSAKTAPVWTALCHCESCRRACSAPVVAWMGFSVTDVEWTGKRKFYRSSEIATRGFCPECGTQMSFESARWPGEIHLYGVSRDDAEAYAPQLQCHYGERLKWLHETGNLPTFPGSAEFGEPTG